MFLLAKNSVPAHRRNRNAQRYANFHSIANSSSNAHSAAHYAH